MGVTVVQDDPLTISLVTPNHNGALHLADCLDSIAAQHYPALEHVIVDGASTDGSMNIVNTRRERYASIISEPDRGHADALNKGFARTSGEIMGWLNSDDMLHPGCLETVDRIFRANADVAWITGRPSSMTAEGVLNYVGPARPWSRLRFLSGDHLWIQQESTFWRRSLWEAAGARLDDGFAVANDFELWARFFRHAELHTVDRMLGCFRIRPGQRSVIQARLYVQEVNAILARELERLDPDYARPRLDVLPDRPRKADPERAGALEPGLARDDPPMIHVSALRCGEMVDGLTAVRPRLGAMEPDITVRVSGWRKTLTRNWRFLAAAGAAALGSAALAAVVEPWRIWIALIAGTGLALAVTLGVAVKTRRIVARLERGVALALAGRAEAEMRRQDLELELDRLGARLEGCASDEPKRD